MNPQFGATMNDSDFYQEPAYIYDYNDYTDEEIESMRKRVAEEKKDDECQRGIIIIDILGE
jgi:hypothetical protein